jgi:serine/threonine protein kinase
LYGYLQHQIMPQLGACGKAGFRVFGSFSSHTVCIYEDRATGKRAVGKFFGAGAIDREKARRKMYRELNNISEFSSYTDSCHHVAGVLGCNESLNYLLVIEYCYGEALDSVIRRSIYEKNAPLLMDKLRSLGYFLATVHNRSARPVMVDFQRICNYFESLIQHLSGILHHGEAAYLHALCERYRHDRLMYQDQEVLVHGDATPANFFFGDGMHVITFDLERMQRSDRLFDTGRIAGELQHYFLQYTGNKYAAEPFISYFLKEYCSHFPDCRRAFASITARLPFYMGMNLLRIARNNYLDYFYRRKLIEEAKLTLS